MTGRPTLKIETGRKEGKEFLLLQHFVEGRRRIKVGRKERGEEGGRRRGKNAFSFVEDSGLLLRCSAVAAVALSMRQVIRPFFLPPSFFLIGVC